MLKLCTKRPRVDCSHINSDPDVSDVKGQKSILCGSGYTADRRIRVKHNTISFFPSPGRVSVPRKKPSEGFPIPVTEAANKH